MIRRVVGVALAAFMLHLNLQRADVVCADHSHTARAAAPMEHAQGEHHHMPMAATEHTASEKNCETPVQRDCCQALVACSTVFGLDAALSAVDLTVLPDRVVSAVVIAPLSRVSAPEPPPPKA